MKRDSVSEYNGICVNDDVCVTDDDGFHAGKPVLRRVRGITVVDWEPSEQRRLNVPGREVFYSFTDGTHASSYDSIRKVGMER